MKDPSPEAVAKGILSGSMTPTTQYAKILAEAYLKSYDTFKGDDGRVLVRLADGETLVGRRISVAWSAALHQVRAEENEACAQIAEREKLTGVPPMELLSDSRRLADIEGSVNTTAKSIATAIRTRVQNPPCPASPE